MAKKIETCMFCEATPCECEGSAKPKRTRAPRKKAADVVERGGSDGRTRKPRADMESHVAREEAVDVGNGSVAERPGLRNVSDDVRTDVAGVRSVQGDHQVHVRSRKPSTPDEVRALRTLKFFGLLAPEEVVRFQTILTIQVEGKLLKEV